MIGANLSEQVSTPQAYSVPAVGAARFRVAAIDLGIKAMTPTQMAKRGITVEVVPATISVAELAALDVDGLFLSNGPGDPATAAHTIDLVTWALRNRLPVFGICFGNQILARALGFDTYKLRFGHRGINQPVMDLRTRKVEITSQNHGFAVAAPIGDVVETPFGRVQVSHVGLNDNVVEGIECLDVPAFSVQYHPEAAAGPHDAEHLFDRFLNILADSDGGDNA
jgi:carbamoyl-phosphate synthase small subunit